MLSHGVSLKHEGWRLDSARDWPSCHSKPISLALHHDISNPKSEDNALALIFDKNHLPHQHCGELHVRPLAPPIGEFPSDSDFAAPPRPTVSLVSVRRPGPASGLSLKSRSHCRRKDDSSALLEVYHLPANHLPLVCCSTNRVFNLMDIHDMLARRRSPRRDSNGL